MTQWGLDALFNPAKRHMDEEKRRLQSTRSEVGDNSGGKRIDLESGKVVIAKSDEDGPDEIDDAADADVANRKKVDGKRANGRTADGKRADGAAVNGGTRSPAAERAAKRRASRTTS